MWIEEMIDADGRKCAEVHFESEADYVVVIAHFPDAPHGTTLINPAKLAECEAGHKH